MNRPCAHHFFLAFKKLNAKTGPLSPSTKGLGFKVKPNQRSQAELMGVFQAHRRRAQRIWKHLHKAVYHKRNIQFSSCSHLHGGLRNSYSQSLHYQRLNFCSLPSQILVTALSLLSRLLTGAFPVQLPKCMPNSSLPWPSFASYTRNEGTGSIATMLDGSWVCQVDSMPSMHGFAEEHATQRLSLSVERGWKSRVESLSSTMEIEILW